MADKKTAASGGINDITSLMSNQGLADLSWLNVDEATYRAFEALPKQNLDIVPELMKGVTMQDGVPHVTPMRPHTVVNQNPSDVLPTASIDLTAPIRNRVARLVMAGFQPADIADRLQLEFARGDILLARGDIQEILAERGVLGNVYIDAQHFPRAAFDRKERKVALELSKSALYVVGGCGGAGNCPCHKTGLCSTFGGKQVVAEVPWGAKVAAHYAPRLASEKRPIDFSGMGSGHAPVGRREWKERLRAAFNMAPIVVNPDGVKRIHTQAAPRPVPITKADIADFWARRQIGSTAEPLPSAAYMKYARRMMDGHDDTAMLIASGDPELASLASEYGLLGHSYVDIDALGGCRQALDLIGKAAQAPDFAVRRSSSCPHCKCADDGACARIGKLSFLVDRRPGFDIRSFARALLRAASKGHITAEQVRTAAANAKKLSSPSWTALTAKVNLIGPPKKAAAAAYSGIATKTHFSSPGREGARVPVDPAKMRMSISHLMNTGLTGRDLTRAVMSQWTKNDLLSVPEIGRKLAAEDGVQGVYFIDPTAYSDYGRGCDSGSKLFRKKEGSAPYVQVASGCTGCTLQTAPGWCSKYAKQLIRQIPTQVRKASADAKRKLPVLQPVVENPVEKWELASEVSVDLGPSREARPEVTIPGYSIGD